MITGSQYSNLGFCSMNNPQPLVSIITIVYNDEKHLEQTIQSVLNQTYPHTEYIIIDGGSTDNTVSIIKKYSDRLAYWISERDGGISDAFNKGISKVSGEIVGIINADDWYETDAVENVVLSIKNYDVAYGNMMYWKNGERDMVVHGRHDYLKHEMTLNHPTVFVKKYCYEQYGVFNNNVRKIFIFYFPGLLACSVPLLVTLTFPPHVS